MKTYQLNYVELLQQRIQRKSLFLINFKSCILNGNDYKQVRQKPISSAKSLSSPDKSHEANVDVSCLYQQCMAEFFSA